jgi:hypothetical protein
LLQGTLDLLILRTLNTGPMHGWSISERIEQVSSDVLQIGRDRFILHCTASNAGDGSKPNGVSRNSGVAPASTA